MRIEKGIKIIELFFLSFVFKVPSQHTIALYGTNISKTATMFQNVNKLKRTDRENLWAVLRNCLQYRMMYKILQTMSATFCP